METLQLQRYQCQLDFIEYLIRSCPQATPFLERKRLALQEEINFLSSKSH